MGKKDEELRSLFQIVIDDIKYAKNQQFRITYYVLLILVAAVGFYDLITTDSQDLILVHKFFLFVPAFIISVLGMWHLMDTQKNLSIYRLRLLKIFESFETETKHILAISQDKTEDYPRYGRYFLTMTLPFVFMIAVGVTWTAWFVFRRNDILISMICYVVLAEVLFFLIFWLINNCGLERVKRELDQRTKERTIREKGRKKDE